VSAPTDDASGVDPHDSTAGAVPVEPSSEPEPETPLLAAPADGTPDPITMSSELAAVIERMRSATGPLAVDAERASGYRYSQRAYLVQLRRAGVGTVLIDPIALPALAHLDAAIGDAEWILHAANQDLPCLAEIGLHPRRLFDTELAGRLLGTERVSLGTMVEQYLGVRLEKGHSAADWSTRPLPHDWLVYAALDVELLVALRDVLADLLRAAGKDEWAAQEFEAVRLAPAAPARIDPWRRTSGIHKLRSRRQLAYVRALWYARDDYAARQDIAPGRVLRDQSIIDAARLAPATATELTTVAGFGGPRQRRHLSRWLEALATARALGDEQLPPQAGPLGDGIPPTSRWADRQPEAVGRLTRCRMAVNEIAEARTVLAQNLLASEVLRRLSWEPPEPADVTAVAERLAELGARPWQVELTAPGLAAALT
jgi:ribonuclease D